MYTVFLLEDHIYKLKKRARDWDRYYLTASLNAETLEVLILKNHPGGASLSIKSGCWSHERHWCPIAVAAQTSGPRDTPCNNGLGH